MLQLAPRPCGTVGGPAERRRKPHVFMSRREAPASEFQHKNAFERRLFGGAGGGRHRRRRATGEHRAAI